MSIEVCHGPYGQFTIYSLKMRSKNKYKYFPFQNMYFLNVLTFVKIVPTYNT